MLHHPYRHRNLNPVTPDLRRWLNAELAIFFGLFLLFSIVMVGLQIKRTYVARQLMVERDIEIWMSDVATGINGQSAYLLHGSLTSAETGVLRQSHDQVRLSLEKIAQVINHEVVLSEIVTADTLTSLRQGYSALVDDLNTQFNLNLANDVEIANDNIPVASLSQNLLSKIQETNIARRAKIISYDTWLLVILVIQSGLVVVGAFWMTRHYISPSFEKNFRLLARRNLQLQNIDLLKSEFLSIASHQLRTPLSELKWTLTLLTREMSERATLREKELLTQSRDSTATMIKLVTNLLNIARIEQGRLEYNPQRIDLIPMINSIMGTVEVPAKLREVALETSFSAKKIESIVDALLMKQALQNLVENGVRYNRPGGKVIVKVSTEHSKTIIQVIDTGIGMTNDDQKQLFTKFYRSVDAVRSHPDGSGLGLYFTKKIIEKHHGKISVHSHSGQGTTFEIVLKNR